MVAGVEAGAGVWAADTVSLLYSVRTQHLAIAGELGMVEPYKAATGAAAVAQARTVEIGGGEAAA